MTFQVVRDRHEFQVWLVLEETEAPWCQPEAIVAGCAPMLPVAIDLALKTLQAGIIELHRLSYTPIEQIAIITREHDIV